MLGHRVEGQRQRGREEGQTFTKKVNEKIMPEFLSVTDDPTLRTLAGTELSGFYRYDDEGIPASRVEVVKDGMLKNFLMGRLAGEELQQFERTRPRPSPDRCRSGGRAI